MTQQATTRDPWNVVDYEAEMLFELCRLIDDSRFSNRSKLERNAIVESACLHMRILIDILLSKNSGRGDDIKLQRLLPGFQDSSLRTLEDVYHHGTSAAPCRILNKMLAHPTLARGTEYDYTKVIRKLLPVVEMVWSAIEKHLTRTTARPVKKTGALNPNFCAKTGL